RLPVSLCRDRAGAPRPPALAGSQRGRGDGAPRPDPIAGEARERRVADGVDRVGAEDGATPASVEERVDYRLALVAGIAGLAKRGRHRPAEKGLVPDQRDPPSPELPRPRRGGRTLRLIVGNDPAEGALPALVLGRRQLVAAEEGAGEIDGRARR